MRKLLALTLITVFFVISPGIISADGNWSDEAELSFVDTSGNTDTTSLSAKNNFKYKFTEKIIGTWKLAILYGETDGERSAERYFTELRSDYLINDRWYGAILGSWLKDKFAGIDARYNIAPLLGYNILIGPVHFLKTEAGVNYVYEEYTNATDDNFIKGRLFGEYNWVFSEKNQFIQTLETLFDLEDAGNYDINSETALITSINDNFSLKTSYVIEYENEPATSDTEHTDRFLSLTLIVSF